MGVPVNSTVMKIGDVGAACAAAGEREAARTELQTAQLGQQRLRVWCATPDGERQ